MAAFALKSGNVTVTADLRKETRFRDDFLRGRGVVGALTVPLHVNAKPFGVLGVYTTAPRQFSSDDVTFAETIAHLLSASIARIKAEQKLQEAHEIKSSLLGMVDSMVMTLDMEGRVVDMNRACEELTKFRLDDVRDRPFWQAMVAPDDAELVKIIFQSSRGSQIPSEFEGEVLTRDGSRRRRLLVAEGAFDRPGPDDPGDRPRPDGPSRNQGRIAAREITRRSDHGHLGPVDGQAGRAARQPREPQSVPQEWTRISKPCPNPVRTVPESATSMASRPAPQSAEGLSLSAGHRPHERSATSRSGRLFRSRVLGYFRLRVLFLHGPVAEVRNLGGRPRPVRPR